MSGARRTRPPVASSYGAQQRDMASALRWLYPGRAQSVPTLAAALPAGHYDRSLQKATERRLRVTPSAENQASPARWRPTSVRGLRLRLRKDIRGTGRWLHRGPSRHSPPCLGHQGDEGRRPGMSVRQLPPDVPQEPPGGIMAHACRAPRAAADVRDGTCSLRTRNTIMRPSPSNCAWRSVGA